MAKSEKSLWGKLQAAVKSISLAESPVRDGSARQNQPIIIIVSGLPRSGTSLMMQMLEAGGLSPLTDEIRTADSDNPQGYYEFERVKKLDKGDTAWLAEAQGKAVKVISMLLPHLPPDYAYHIIFMQRRLEETLASQKQMLTRRDKPTDAVSDEEMKMLFEKHLNQVEAWLAAQPNLTILYVDYNELLTAPAEQIQQINRFLGGRLDEEKMIGVINPKLYRQRA